MVTKTIINGMKLVFALALVQAPFISPQANAACKPKDECQTKFDEVAAHDAALGATSSQPVEGQSNQGNKAANAGLSKSAIACPAVDTCKTKKKECDAEAMKKPKPLCQPTDCEEVEKQVVALTATCATGNTVAADGAKTQTAAESKGTGAGGEMMGALLGAAMGVGMAMLMNQEEEEEIPPMPEMPYNGALQPNGTIDCSKPDSFQFRDCNTAMEARCMTMLDDPSCQQFSARYCGHRGGGGGRGA